jgi:uncharacterized hydrophobic protein (TIGR00271 family)
VVTSPSQVDIEQMRDQVFFEGPEHKRRLSRYWLLLLLSAVIATAGVVSDSTATVIGAVIIAPLMTPILGVVLGVVTADRANLRRCLLLLAAGAAAVVALSWLMGHLVPYPVIAATNSQVAARVTPRLVDLVAALATGSVGSVALARPDISDTLPGVAIAICWPAGPPQPSKPETCPPTRSSAVEVSAQCYGPDMRTLWLRGFQTLEARLR